MRPLRFHLLASLFLVAAGGISCSRDGDALFSDDVPGSGATASGGSDTSSGNHGQGASSSPGGSSSDGGNSANAGNNANGAQAGSATSGGETAAGGDSTRERAIDGRQEVAEKAIAVVVTLTEIEPGNRRAVELEVRAQQR